MFKKLRRQIFNLTHPVIGEIWQLHHVNYDEGEYCITPEKLENLIIEYRNKGYRFVSLDDAVSGKVKKFISITLDDGYEDNFTNAFPVFVRQNCPFCIFVATDFVYNDARRVKEKGMTPEQLLEISKHPLCTIGGHTVSHCHLNIPDECMLADEIIGCRKLLEDKIGVRQKHFSYPYGDYDSSTLKIMKESGYDYGYAAWGGGIRATKLEKLHICRIKL